MWKIKNPQRVYNFRININNKMGYLYNESMTLQNSINSFGQKSWANNSIVDDFYIIKKKKNWKLLNSPT